MDAWLLSELHQTLIKEDQLLQAYALDDAIKTTLEFLDNGSYEASIFADADDAHYRDNQFGIIKQRKHVGKNDVFDIYMAPGGGFAIKLKALT